MKESDRYREGSRGVLWKPLGILFWIVLWGVLARLLDLPLFLPGPMEVGEELLSLSQSQAFWQELLRSVLRICAGFVLGIALGIGSGLLASRWFLLKTLTDPLYASLRSMPVAAVTILALYWVSHASLSTVIVILAVAPLLYESTLGGIDNRDRELLEMARVFRLSSWSAWLIAVRPALWAHLKPALSHTAGLAWKAGISGEIIAQPMGTLGSSMVSAKITLSTAALFAYVAVIILCSALPAWIARRFSRRRKEKNNGQELFRRITVPRKPSPLGKVSGESRGTAAVKIRHLSHRYGQVQVLDDFSADFPRGEISVIMGETGSGKTTLLRLLLGLERLQSGELSFSENGNTVKSADEPRFSCCFQEPRLVLWLSGLENLVLAGADPEFSRSILAEAGIDRPDQRTEEYSGGMKQKIALLRAMLSESDIILMDEPFKGLDPSSRRKMMELVQKLRQGKTLILTTHQEEERLYFAGHQVIIDRA